MDTKNKIFTIVGAVALVAATGVGGYMLFTTEDSTNTTVATSAPSETSSVAVSSASVETPAMSGTAADYVDGTYTASTSYSVPKGDQNTITATVVVNNGEISSVKTTHDYADRESGMYIDSFDSSITSHAGGQSLMSYSPSRIGGASLTTAAFGTVLDTIRSQASA